MIESKTKPRMRDIAAYAGVSVGTVSRALSGKSDVAPEFVEKVLKAASEVGYRPRSANRFTQASSQAIGTVGYLVDAEDYSTVATDSFQQHFLSGIEKSVSDRNGHVLFATCREEIQRNGIPAMISRKLVDGVIIKSGVAATDPWLQKINTLVPVVTLMHNSVNRSLPSVMCDNFGGMYQVLGHLRELGHTRIALFYEKDLSPSLHHLERDAAYRSYLPLLGCVEHPVYIQTPVREPGEDLPAVIRKGIARLMALGVERPTALVATADIYGLLMLQTAPSLGIRVPEDLSVASFMNTAACDYSNPPLTSVALSGEEIGSVAVELLQDRLRNPKALVRHVTVGVQLIKRGSCGPAPA